MKNKKLDTTLLVVIAILLGVVVFYLINMSRVKSVSNNEPLPIPEIPSPKSPDTPKLPETPKKDEVVKTFKFNENFRAVPGQTYFLNESGTYFAIQIKKLYYSPCPPDVMCVWSGVRADLVVTQYGVSEDLFINSQGSYVKHEKSGYIITAVQFDSENFIVLKVTR